MHELDGDSSPGNQGLGLVDPARPLFTERSNDPVAAQELAWLEHHLLSPVMARYATARPVEILYASGGEWLDATAVAKLGLYWLVVNRPPLG